MEFIYISIILTLVILVVFYFLRQKAKKITEVLIDAVTFNLGLSLFLYVLLGKVLQMSAFANMSGDYLVLACLIASFALMSSAADGYYKSAKKQGAKIWGGKNGN
jgi:surface polysaccharide O-acyltransferase-like enzyme